MKLIIDYAADIEPQVTVRGDPEDPQVRKLIEIIRKAEAETGTRSHKAELYRDEEMFFMEAENIAYFEAAGDRVTAHTADGEYVSRLRLYQLEEQLGEEGFVQVSKGVLLNVNAVRSVQAEFSGNYTAALRELPQRIIISRRYFKAFKNAVMKGR